jgi:hypothetical protein
VDRVLGDTEDIVAVSKNGEFSLAGQTLIDNKE